MLPPTSARKAVRLRNASTILGLCSVYGYLTSVWVGFEDEHKQDRACDINMADQIPAQTGRVDGKDPGCSSADPVGSVGRQRARPPAGGGVC